MIFILISLGLSAPVLWAAVRPQPVAVRAPVSNRSGPEGHGSARPGF